MKLLTIPVVYLIGRSNLLVLIKLLRTLLCKPLMYLEDLIRDTPISKKSYEYQKQQALMAAWLDSL